MINDAQELADFYRMAAEVLRTRGHEPGGEPVCAESCDAACHAAVMLMKALSHALALASGEIHVSRIAEWQIHRAVGWNACELAMLLHGAVEARHEKTRLAALSAREQARAWVTEYRAAHPCANLTAIRAASKYKPETLEKHAGDLLPAGLRGPPKK